MRMAALQAAGDDITAGDADMGLQPSLGVAHTTEGFVNVERSAGGSHWIVVVRLWCAEQRHHGIADVLVDSASIVGDDPVNESRVVADEFVHLLRIDGLRQRREAAKVGEHDRDLPALAGRGLRANGRSRWRGSLLRNRSQQTLAMT